MRRHPLAPFDLPDFRLATNEPRFQYTFDLAEKPYAPPLWVCCFGVTLPGRESLNRHLAEHLR